MKQSDFLKWDIDLIDASYQDTLGCDYIEDNLADIANKISASTRIKEIVKPVAQKLTQAFSSGMNQDDQSTEQIDKAKRQMLIFKITGRLGERFKPVLDEMDRYLFTTDSQTAATNQHNQKMRDDQFRKEFLSELRQIAQLLPENHPVRLKIETSR